MTNYLERLVRFYQKIISVVSEKSFDTATEEGRSKERYRRVIITGSSSVIYKGITILTGLISIPLTANYLGAERYGMWMAITSAMAFLSFADLGLGNGLLNAISKSDGKNDRKYALTAVSSVFYMLVSITILLGGIFFFIYQYIPWHIIFNVTSDVAIKEAGPTVAMLVIMFLFNMPLGIIQKIQIGYQAGYKNQLWLAAGAILGLIGVLVVIYFEGGLPWLVFAFMGGPLVSLLLNGYFLFSKSSRWLLPKFSEIDFKVGKRLAGVGVVFLFLQLFTVLGNSADNIIIAQILGAASVASYAITKKIFLIIQFGQFIIAPLWPAFGEAMARKEYEWVKSALIRTLKLSIGIGVVTALPFLIFGKEIILFWVGEEFVPSHALIAGFFIWAIFTNYGGTMSVFLNNDDLIKKQLLFLGLSSIFAIIFQVFLCYTVGVEGVVFGAIISYVIFYVVPAYRLTFGTLNGLILKSIK